ncbi:MFS transporter [Streptomyces sp. NPDC056503]|uniref:MFS transporter n=1 Tax=Streptomyces sp. NPDC056503 TaxID=3345842 RepID=UPI00369861E7
MEGQASAPAEAEVREPRSLLRNRHFLLLWAGQTVGELGARITTVVVPLVAATTLHASAFQIALLTSFAWLPFLFFSLPAGILADRLDQRKLMVGCDLGRVALMTSVPVVAGLGELPLWYLYVVVSASGMLSVLFSVAYRARMPVVVKAHHLADGTAKLETSREFAEFTGPALGGLLVDLFGATRAFLGNGLAYLVSAVTLWFDRTPAAEDPAEETEAAEEREPLRKEVAEGLAFIRGRSELLAILACSTTSNFFVMAVSSLGVTFMVRELDAHSWMVGLASSISAVVGIAVGLVANRAIQRIGTARAIRLAMAVPGPLYLLMPLAPAGWGFVLYGCGLAAFSVNAVLYNVAATSYRQRITPSHLLGRVNASFLWICYGVIPLGALFGGAMAAWFGLRTALLVSVLGMWSAALFVVFSPLRRMRDLPEE